MGDKKWYDKFLKDFNQFVTNPQIMDYSEWRGIEEKYVGFHVSAEEGNTINDIPAWNYYGEEYKHLYPNDWKTLEVMEKFLEEHNAFAEWYSPGDLNIYKAD